MSAKSVDTNFVRNFHRLEKVQCLASYRIEQYTNLID